MTRLKDACPYEAKVRASRCESCCEVNEGLTPCVAAWLSASPRVRATNVIEFPARERKAA